MWRRGGRFAGVGAVLALLFVVVIAACAGDDDYSASKSPGASPTSDAASDDTTTTGPASSETSRPDNGTATTPPDPCETVTAADIQGPFGVTPTQKQTPTECRYQMPGVGTVLVTTRAGGADDVEARRDSDDGEALPNLGDAAYEYERSGVPVVVYAAGPYTVTLQFIATGANSGGDDLVLAARSAEARRAG